MSGNGPPEVEGTVATGAGDTDWCPPCGTRRRVNGKGQFRPHPPANPDPQWPTNCWASGYSRAEAEQAEALGTGCTWASLE